MLQGPYLRNEGSGNGDVILQRGNLWPVFRHCHGQQTLVLEVRHNDCLGPCLLGIVCLQSPSTTFHVPGIHRLHPGCSNSMLQKPVTEIALACKLVLQLCATQKEQRKIALNWQGGGRRVGRPCRPSPQSSSRLCPPAGTPAESRAPAALRTRCSPACCSPCTQSPPSALLHRPALQTAEAICPF